MESHLWSWDASRQDWFYWDPEIQAWRYQKGLIVHPPAPSLRDLRAFPPSVALPAGPGHNDSSQSRESTTPATISGRLIQGDPKDMTETSLFTRGTVAHGRIGGLDLEYKVRRPGKDFFKVGKVFKALWPETMDPLNDMVTFGTDTGLRNEYYVPKIRCFVVVKAGRDCCSCLPITTYGGRGCGKPGIVKWQHAIIYTGENEPPPRDDERPAKGEDGMMSAIRVRPASTEAKLDPLARINFGTKHTVEHNVKAYDFGDVYEDFIKTLLVQRKHILSRDVVALVDEEEEEEEGGVDNDYLVSLRSLHASWGSPRETSASSTSLYKAPNDNGISNSSLTSTQTPSPSTTTRPSRSRHEQVEHSLKRPIRPKALYPLETAVPDSLSPRIVRIHSSDGTSKTVSVLPPSAPSSSGRRRPGYSRPQPPKLLCPYCQNHPEGFRGEHELQRHTSLAHSPVRKAWICVDASEDGRFLAQCKACVGEKKYGAYYNAAAQAHFNPRKRGRKAKTDAEKRGGKGGVNWPAMDVLKERWMREVEEIVDDLPGAAAAAVTPPLSPFSPNDYFQYQNSTLKGLDPMSPAVVQERAAFVGHSQTMIGRATEMEQEKQMITSVDSSTFIQPPAFPTTSNLGGNFGFEGKKLNQLEDPLPRHSVPPTDSGYASILRHEPKNAMNTGSFEQHTTDGVFQHQLTEDEAYPPEEMDTANDTTMYEQNPEGIQSDDAKTVYSDTSSLPALNHRYISEFAEYLLGRMPSKVLDEQTVQRMPGILPDLLKAFALKFGHNAESEVHLKIMVFLHKHRSEITQIVQNHYLQDEDIPDIQKFDHDRMPLEDKMRDWFGRDDVDIPLNPDVNDFIVEEENSYGNPDISDFIIEEEETDVPELREYRDLISNSPAYEWLLACIRREFLLTPAHKNSMEAIRNKIIGSLPSSHEVSRRRCVESYKITFETEWDPLAFVDEQNYEEDPCEAVERAITLTGTAKDGQALTCAQYLRQTWPASGEYVMQLVKDVVRSGRGHRHTCIFPDSTRLNAWICNSKFMVEAFGTGFSVAEVGEQFAWLGSALRTSPYKSGVAYCTPFISDILINDASNLLFGSSSRSSLYCKMEFTTQQTEDCLESSNGQCWHNMFRNPVIVKGYPILRRSELYTGLEVPLGMMTGLARTKRVDAFNGNIFIKGFSTMLMPTKQIGDLIIWHLLYTKDGSRISYLNDFCPHLENMHVSDVEKARHVVGWCADVRNYAGAPNANYNINRSGLPEPHPGCVMEKVSICCGKVVTGGVAFTIGIKDTPIHASQDGYIAKLRWIHDKFVLLWDEGDKRGWLVNGTSALLHLTRASLEHNRTDKFNSAFLFDSKDMKEAKEPYTTDSAIEVLLDSNNMQLKIYPEKGTTYEEETTRIGSQPEEVFKRQKKFIRFEDRVEHFYNVLEKIVEHQIEVCGRSGVNLKLRARKYLEGWDFKDLATERDPFYPRVATLPAIGKGWVDLIRKIHAITLFGRGFGDIIKPSANMPCSYWSSVPTEKYYLAAGISVLKQIIELDGDRTSNPLRLSSNIVWHNPSKMFSPCNCTDKRSRRRCDFAQVLLPSNLAKVLPKKKQNAILLDSPGAVVFGHSLIFNWHWKDTGDPEMEGNSTLSEELETLDDQTTSRSLPSRSPKTSNSQFHDSGIGSMQSSSASGEAADTSYRHTSNEGSSGEPQFVPSGVESLLNSEQKSTKRNGADSGKFNKPEPQSALQTQKSYVPTINPHEPPKKRPRWHF